MDVERKEDNNLVNPIVVDVTVENNDDRKEVGVNGRRS